MSPQETDALLAIAALAAHADGHQVESEREEVEAISTGLAAAVPAAAERGHLPRLARTLRSPGSRRRAFEAAVAVCDSDGTLSPEERSFLSELAQELGIEREEEAEVERRGDALAAAPLASAPAADDAGTDELIRRTAILCGGLELLPQGLASLAILPLQMRMVYAIGKHHGYELDRGHLKEFVAAVGLGLTSQYLESFARRLVGGLLGRIAGGFLRGLAGPATGAAFTFAATHALGQVARRYYAGGRELSAAELKDAFASLFDDARGLADRHAGDMQRRASSVDLSDLLSLVKGGP
jgi:tellurite resistance protein/uncharacterized protein (DUF697 family)